MIKRGLNRILHDGGKSKRVRKWVLSSCCLGSLCKGVHSYRQMYWIKTNKSRNEGCGRLLWVFRRYVGIPCRTENWEKKMYSHNPMMRLKTNQDQKKCPPKNTQFAEFWPFQLSIYTVWHEESDVQVKIWRFQHLDGQSYDVRTYNILSFLCVNLLRFFF